MTSWIVKIGKTTPQHWVIARDDGFWDVREPGPFRDIAPGEDVFFWLSGTGFRSWVRATSSLYMIGPSASPAHWTDDHNQYSHRFEFELVSEDVTRQATWGEMQVAAGRNYAPPAPANPVNEPATSAFVKSLFGNQADITFTTIPVAYQIGEDMRERAERQIALRRGQARFRNSLIDAYRGRCAVTDSAVISVLEAAHIDRYFGTHTNRVANGLLLRSDIHALFDLGLITVSSHLTVQLAPWLRDSEYGNFHDKPLTVPLHPVYRPDSDALRRHRKGCEWYHQ